MDLTDITTKLGRAYKIWKREEKKKESLKDEFFDIATKEYKDPKEIETTIEAKTEEELFDKLQKLYPEYKLIDYQQNGRKKSYKVFLRENLYYRPFKYVNPLDKQVYSKIRQAGLPFLDEKALQEDDPELWEKITRKVEITELIPMDELSPEIISELRKYIFPGRPIMKLAAPRKATAEELEG